ncbi:MAG: iron-sulfur cluster carrier protein ApbC [Gammaproteobacteria bacterium]|nr:iron-sulfur cluster carrier protein ApbC [Gammaproteobacteria bacterium]
MSGPTESEVESALREIIDPHTDQDPVKSKYVKNILVEGDRVTVDIQLGYPAKTWADEYAGMIRDKLAALDAASEVAVNVTSEIISHTVQKGVKPLPEVKNIIAVASGKGGVGKSTVAVNLALALSADGAKVGILDADIYGPSQPRMLGVNAKPESKDGKSMEPLHSYHLQSMSIGFLIDEETPMIWRGPMVTQALEQLLKDTSWSDLDYLIIDLPPGTGDTQLTLAQRVPVSGAVIVTTPQDIALLDARKAYKMFEKVEIPILGVVENMSTHICSQCGHEEHIFGEGGGQRMAEEYGLNYLGSVPLDMQIRVDADGGRPTVVADPDGAVASTYRAIARRAAGKLATQKKDYSAKFPSIVIESN